MGGILENIREFSDKAADFFLGIVNTYDLAYVSANSFHNKVNHFSNPNIKRNINDYVSEAIDIKNYFVDSLDRVQDSIKHTLNIFSKNKSKNKKTSTKKSSLENIVGADYFSSSSVNYYSPTNIAYNYQTKMQSLSKNKTVSSNIANILSGKYIHSGKRVWSWQDRKKEFDKYITNANFPKEERINVQDIKNTLNTNSYLIREYNTILEELNQSLDKLLKSLATI